MNFHVNTTSTTRLFLLSCFLGAVSLSHAGLMCFSNNLGNTGATASACGNTTGAPVTSQVNTQGGNPIDLLSGNKYQLEADFPSLPGALGLEFRRSYNSQSRETGILGYGWRSTYELRLQDSGDKVQILQADGKRISFEVKAFPFKGVTTSHLFVNRCVSSRPEDGWVERVPKGGWIWHLPSGDVYRFDVDTSPTGSSAMGRLASITNVSKSAWTTLSYSAKDGKLVSIADRAGRKVIFKHQLTQYHLPQISVITPIGQFEYFQDKQGNLAQVVYPDGRRVGYAYDPRYQGGDNHNMTDKFQYLMILDRKTGQKSIEKKLLAHWEYDNSDRTTLSEHAGGVERLRVAYDTKSVVRPLMTTDKNQRFNNTITNSLGQKTVYSYHLDGTRYLIDKIVGAGCVTCGENNIAYTYTNGGQIKNQRWLAKDGSVLRTLTNEYDAFGRVKSTSVQAIGADDAAHTVNYAYVNNDLQSDNRMNGWLIKTTSEASIIAGQQKITTYDYDATGNKIAETQVGYSPAGERLSRTTRFGYNAKGQMIWQNGALPDVQGHPEQSDIDVYTYDNSGLLSGIDAAYLGKSLRIRRDSFGRVSQFIRTKDDQTERFVYDYTRLGQQQRIRYYPNKETKDTDALGVQYVYNDQGLKTHTYDLKGQLVQENKFDAANRLELALSREAGLVKYTRDTEDQIIRKQHRKNQTDYSTRDYRYEGYGQLTGIANDGKLASTVQYFADGRSGIVRDAKGHEQWLQYTGDSQLKTKIRVPHQIEGFLSPDTVKIDYQARQQTIKQSDGSTTTYAYDDFGRLAMDDSSIAGQITYRYDQADRLLSISKATGTVTQFEYDARSRRIARTVTSPNLNGQKSNIEKTAWTFDHNRLVAVNNTNQQTVFHYNNNGMVTAKSMHYRGLKQPIKTYYAYNNQNKMQTITLPDGMQMSSSGQSLSTRAADDIFTQDFFTQISDKATHQVRYRLGDHIDMAYEYNAQGQWSGLHYATTQSKSNHFLINSAYADEENPTLFSERWQFDTQHRLRAISERDQAKQQQYDFRYNANNHLIGVFKQDLGTHEYSNLSQPFVLPVSNSLKTPSVVSERYFYDAMGNRLLSQEATPTDSSADATKAVTQGYHYDQNRMSERRNSQGVSLAVAYNNAGQPLRYGNQHFKYINGQIAEVYRLVADQQQVIAQYQYNEVGQRIAKTVFEDAKKNRLAQPETRYFVYEGSLLLHELNAEGRITRHYVYIGEQLIATVDYAGRGRALQHDEPSAWNKVKQVVSGTIAGDQPQAVWNYVLTDHLGRPRLVVDAEQKTKWRFAATPFGGTGQAVNTVAGQRPYEMPIRFKGQYADAETQLYYNGWRYYDPSTGRYTTPDPLGLKGGENLYGYVNQQPVQYDDPQGLLLFSFDGTGNKDYFEANDGYTTGRGGDDQRNSNVVRFRDVYMQQPDDPTKVTTNDKTWKGMLSGVTYDKKGSKFVDGFYISGAGTEDQYTHKGSNTSLGGARDSGTGSTLPERVDMMLDYFSQYLTIVIDEQNKAKNALPTKNMAEVAIQNIDIDVTGFSRGAASARMFASKLDHLMKADIKPSNWTGLTQADLDKSNICVSFRFLGLWDTVPALGLDDTNDMKETKDQHMDLTIPDSFKYVAHAVAVNEQRVNFNARSIFNNQEDDILNVVRTDGKVRVEKGFMGAHSDIGGGYNMGDLSDVSLMWMIDQAKIAGVEFDNTKIKDRGFDVVSNPVVHDSTGGGAKLSSENWGAKFFAPGREFRWADDNSQVEKGTAVGQRDAQLGLTWQETLAFQPEDVDKFGDFKKLELEYLKAMETASGKARCGSTIVNRCDELQAIYDFKSREYDDKGQSGDQGTGAKVVLYSNNQTDKNEQIKIQDYLDWISANYFTTLTTK